MLNGKNKIKQDIFSGDFLKRLLPEGKGSRMIFLAGISLLFLIVCLYFFQKNDMKKEEKNIVSTNMFRKRKNGWRRFCPAFEVSEIARS